MHCTAFPASLNNWTTSLIRFRKTRSIKRMITETMLTTIAIISQSRTSFSVSAVIRSFGRTFEISPSIFDVAASAALPFGSIVVFSVVVVVVSIFFWSKSRFLTYQMYLKKVLHIPYCILDTFLLYFTMLLQVLKLLLEQ
mgnify:CR=1 FL=1